MIRKQRTIRTSTSCKGVGLHTGVETSITFHPASENFGIRFIRSDIPGCPEIKADINHVVDISRGTTIEKNGYKVHTVEHVIAATVGLKIDNILIELSGLELDSFDVGESNWSSEVSVPASLAAGNKNTLSLSKAKNLLKNKVI